MICTILTETPVMTLYSGSYNGGSEKNIYMNQIRTLPIGGVIGHSDTRNCGRACVEIELKKVYQDMSGTLLIKTETGTTDSPNPEDWITVDSLWVSYLQD